MPKLALYMQKQSSKMETLLRSLYLMSVAQRFPYFRVAAVASLLVFIPMLRAQDAAPATSPNPDATQNQPEGQQDQQDPLKRQLSDKELRRQRKELKGELSDTYKKWLDVDVRWIITPEEEKAFKSLSNNEERDQFIENFWQRRNPDPDSQDNEFKDEHYRRIEYANEHFAAGKPGWATDRGHMYIAFGPPDEKEEHPSGGSYDRPLSEGGGTTSTYPFEIWTYRYLEGIGDNVNIEFVDTCMCGDFHMTLDRSEKDALAHVSGGGSTLYEQMGMAKRQDRFSGGGIESLGNGPMGSMENAKQFDRISQAAKLMAPPPVKFKDMENFLVTHKVLTGPIFPFDVRTDYVKVTNDTILVPVTVQIRNRDVTYQDKDGVSRGPVNILGRVTTISGRIAQTFEDTVDDPFPSELRAAKMDTSEIYWKALPLRPGTYRLDIVIKDVNNPDHVGIYSRSMTVPKFDDDQIGSSSLILADKMEHVPSKQIGAGNFVIGNTFIRPRVSDAPAVPVTFKRNQKLNFWMQVYNLGIDEKTRHNQATIEYQVTNLTDNKPVLDTSEDSAKLSPNSDQLTLEKSLSLASLQPGKYQVTIKVNDEVSKQHLAESAPFTLE
jgi:GWxTD domain-containing protein